MNFINFKQSLSPFPVFSLADIRAVDANFDRRRLSEWQKKGYITKIVKGFYFFSDIELDENRLFEIANKIYRPSYVSLATALSYYHLIPESVYAVTSVSTRRTITFETTVGRFDYRTIQRRLFFGYLVKPDPLKIASMEKALLDHFYLHPSLKKDTDFAALRLDREAFFDRLDEERLHDYLARFGRRVLTMRIERFLKWIENA